MRKYLLAAALLTGCSNAPSDADRLPEIELEDAPQNGMQLVLPIVRDIPPGKDLELCTWTDKYLDKDVDVESISSAQAGPGHHIVIYTTTVMQPPGTSRPCTDQDMTTFHYVVGAGGEGTGLVNKPPAGLSFYMPKGSQLVINEHFLNASPKVRDGQSAFNLYYADPNKTYIRSSGLTFIDTGLVVPPGASSLDINCTMKEDFAAWRFIPHMHEWGKHIIIEHEQGGQTKRLFDTDWNAGMVFHPPELRATVESPHWFRKGDKIHVRCEWNNDTGKPLPFGKEMCVGSADIVDFEKRGNFFCENNEFSPY
ncbi:MAG: hypothetical protein U1A78_41240 [Polyangia bacterium]